MNWLIVVPLIALAAAVALLVSRGLRGAGGRPMQLKPVLGAMSGVVMGALVVALNHDLVPDQVEIGLIVVLVSCTAIVLTLVAVELVRG